MFTAMPHVFPTFQRFFTHQTSISLSKNIATFKLKIKTQFLSPVEENKNSTHGCVHVCLPCEPSRTCLCVGNLVIDFNIGTWIINWNWDFLQGTSLSKTNGGHLGQLCYIWELEFLCFCNKICQKTFMVAQVKTSAKICRVPQLFLPI